MIRPAHNFAVIGDADWSRMLKAHRALGHYHGNEILRRIRSRVLAQSMVPPSRSIPNLPLPESNLPPAETNLPAL